MFKNSGITFTHIQFLMITLVALFGSAFALSSDANKESMSKADLLPPIDKVTPRSYETATFGLG